MVQVSEEKLLPFSVASIRSVMGLAWKSVCGSWHRLILFSLAFKVVNFVLLAPLASFTMRMFLQRWGRASVGNFEIAYFLLSPTGLTAICCVGGIVIATLYLEIAGLMQIMLRPHFRWWSNSWRSSSRYLALYQRLLRLGSIQLAVLLALGLPFVILVGLVYATLWSGRDLNGLIILKPPEFWWGMGLASALVLAFAVIALFIVLRWFLALPILLCNASVSPWQSLRRSQELSRSNLSLMFACLVVWFVAQTSLATGTLAATHYGITQLLDMPWQTLSIAAFVTGVAFSLEWLLGTAFSVVGNIGFASMALALYRKLASRDDEADDADDGTEKDTLRSDGSNEFEPRAAQFQLRRLLAASAVALLGVALSVAYWICDTLVLKDR